MELVQDTGTQSLTIGDWTLDLGCQRLTCGSASHPLNPKEMSVLLHLAEAAPRLVTTAQLLDRTWPDVVVGDHVLHEVIGRLRKALGDNARQPRYIETLPKRGYRLLVPAAVVNESPRDSAPSATGTPTLDLRVGKRRPSSAVLGLGLLLGLLAAGVLWYFQDDRFEVPLAERDQIGIAVLPFVNLSGDPARDYLGDAIASEIVNELRPSGALRVISMTSSRAFKDGGLDIREIGARLTADFVLEGELMQNGKRVRVNVRLIDTSDGTQVWRNGHVVALSDLAEVFALYDEVAFQAGKAIQQHLGKPGPIADRTMQPTPPDVNATAYHLLLRAAYRFEELGNPGGALPLVDLALELAPQWPNALNAKATFLTRQAEYGMVRGDQGFPAARAWARKAVEIDPTFGEAHATLGFLDAAIDLDFRRAMARFQEAERLGAKVEILWPFKEYILLNAGRYEEALAINREFESISPASAFVKGSIGRLLWRMGRHSEAVVKLEEALELAPTNIWVCTEALRYYVYRVRNVERSSAVIDQCFSGADALSKNLNGYWLANLAHFQGNSGPLAAVADRAEQRSRTRHVDSRSVALMYYRLGRYDKHIEWTRIRVQARQQLIEVPDELRLRPDYWANFREWALAEPDERRVRLALIDQHRSRIERITRGMVL